jgi:hypothetical protein
MAGTFVAAYPAAKSGNTAFLKICRGYIEWAGNPTYLVRNRPDAMVYLVEENISPTSMACKSDGHEAKLAYCGNVMIENRNGLVVDTELLQCNGTTERDAAMMMAERVEGTERITLAADKAYDTKDFVAEMSGMKRDAVRR